jgi:hypothetical protein
MKYIKTYERFFLAPKNDEIRKGEFIVPMLESDMMHVREDVCNNAWAYVDVPDAEFKT